MGNWVNVTDPVEDDYVKEMLSRLSQQLHVVERRDPVAIASITAAVFLFVFAACFALVSCGIQSFLRRWHPLREETSPVPNARENGDDADEDEESREEEPPEPRARLREVEIEEV